MKAQKSKAQERYEAETKARPNYHDGTPRKTWEELDPIAKASWGRPDDAYTTDDGGVK